ncbi:MAG: rhomboid family intramembrane serine protease [Candidatus Cyclobacteriaceae bacterium M2_1C_046]
MMQRLTPVVKNLLIINIVIFILQLVLGDYFTLYISLWTFESEYFKPYQFFTYMFAHSTEGFFHILFNMLGLVFLGPLLEQFWGSQRFLIFYIVCGVGAGLLYNGIKYVSSQSLKADVQEYVQSPNPSDFNRFVLDHVDERDYVKYEKLINAYDENPNNENYVGISIQEVKNIYQRSAVGLMVGASGAVYGILMAFGLLFPNTELMLLFPPIPVKAKYLVLVLGGIALYSGFNRSAGDNVAHFAHLGGMIFAYIMIKFWQGRRDKFY